MKPWVKVAIGCFALLVIAVFLLVAGLVSFGYWAKNRVEEVTGGGEAVAEARRTANAVPFARPAGNVIAESRLVRFIEVRASVFSVYEKYRAEIESRVAKVKESHGLDFGDIATGLTLIGELQKAEALALARHGMSEDEYAFITGEVYKSMWADFGEGGPGKKAIEDAALAAKTAADAMKGSRTAGLPPEARAALARAGSEIAAGSRDASREIENMKTAPENQALFKKYREDLNKYAMPGLNIIFNEKGEAKTPIDR